MRIALSLSVAAAISSLAFAVPALATTGCNAEGWGEERFSDVRGCHSYYPAITYVKEKGIVQGYPDGSFKPEQPINRAEFTKILVNARADDSSIRECYDEVEPAHWAFVERMHNEWYAPYVCYAKKHGLIDGYPDGTFKPGNLINYAEAAKIAANAYGLEIAMEEYEQQIDWWKDQHAWYLPYSNALLKRHAIPPTVGRFAQNLTRGEMAEMIYRLETGKTSAQWFTSLPDGSTVESVAVTNNLPDVEFSYDGSLFAAAEGSMEMRDIYASQQWLAIPGIHLNYVRDEEDSMQCDGFSGMIDRCRPVYSMLSFSIGVIHRPLVYVRMGLNSAFDDIAQEVFVDGRKGISLFEGVEGEGVEHTLVPMDAKRTLVLIRAIDSNERPEEYLSSEEQDALFRSFLDTIDIMVPAAEQSAPLMDVTVLVCPLNSDVAVRTDVPTIAVQQTVPASSGIANATLQALFSFSSMSDAQSCKGVGWISGHYRGVTIVDGVATVKLDATFEEIFHDIDEKDRETYKISVQRSIAANLTQFPSVQSVRYVVQP